MSPDVTDVVVEVLSYLALAAPLGIALTAALLAPAGGTVAAQSRRLALPAAVLVVLAATLDVVTAGPRADTATVIRAVGFALTACGLVAMALRPGRATAATVLVAAVLATIAPQVPTRVGDANALARAVLPAVHLLAAMIWVGGLLTLAIIGQRSRRDAPDQGADEWVRIWEQFSTVALYSVGALLVSGVWLSWTHVGTVGQLFTTDYGRHLAIKLSLVVLLLVAGGYNARVLIPRIRDARAHGDTGSVLHLAIRHFPRVVAAEAVTAIGVLTVVPFLHGSARTQAGWAAARPFDLTVFGTGVLLVALVAATLWLGTRDRRKRVLG